MLAFLSFLAIIGWYSGMFEKLHFSHFSVRCLITGRKAHNGFRRYPLFCPLSHNGAKNRKWMLAFLSFLAIIGCYSGMFEKLHFSHFSVRCIIMARKADNGFRRYPLFCLLSHNGAKSWKWMSAFLSFPAIMACYSGMFEKLHFSHFSVRCLITARKADNGFRCYPLLCPLSYKGAKSWKWMSAYLSFLAIMACYRGMFEKLHFSHFSVRCLITARKARNGCRHFSLFQPLWLATVVCLKSYTFPTFLSVVS